MPGRSSRPKRRTKNVYSKGAHMKGGKRQIPSAKVRAAKRRRK